MDKKHYKYIKPILYASVMLICAALFLIFAPKKSSVPSSSGVHATPVPSVLPKISGVPLSKFLSALETKLDIELTQSLEDDTFSERFKLKDGRDASFSIVTDRLGRVASCELNIAYVYAGEPSKTMSSEVRETILAEYRRRESDDIAFIKSYLDLIFDLFQEETAIGAIDKNKLPASISSAYSSRKSYDKKAGRSCFYCDSQTTDGYTFTFRLLTEFTYSK